MSKFPEPIDLEFEDNEGRLYTKSDEELLAELIEKFNELVMYLDSISERL